MAPLAVSGMGDFMRPDASLGEGAVFRDKRSRASEGEVEVGQPKALRGLCAELHQRIGQSAIEVECGRQAQHLNTAHGQTAQAPLAGAPPPAHPAAHAKRVDETKIDA